MLYGKHLTVIKLIFQMRVQSGSSFFNPSTGVSMKAFEKKANHPNFDVYGHAYILYCNNKCTKP